MYIFIFTGLILYTTGAFCQDTPPPPQFIGKKTGVEISKAQPEDITSENYSEIITSFVFPNAELKDVIKAMSTDLNINIIMDPTIGGRQKISIISYSPITVAEAYQAFLSALAIHNLTVVRSGPFLKIIKKDDAVKSNLKVYTGKKNVDTDQIITSVIKLKHIDAASLEPRMKPFIDAKGALSLIFYPPSNAVIITDHGSNVNKVKKIIQILDIPNQDVVFKVFPIKHAQAVKLRETINSLLPTGKYSSSKSFTNWSNRSSRNKKSFYSSSRQPINIKTLSHDERTNSIIAMGNQEGINKIQELIQQLDYYKDPELAGGIYVYKAKHGTAEELAATLNDLMGHSSSSSTQKAAGRGTSPQIANKSGSRRSNTTKSLRNTNTAQSFQDVRIIAEKNTNSLLIVSNKYNYETLLGILKKVDISRNQVFVKSIIMELSTDRSNEWKMANYFFPEKGGGISRVGYGLSNLGDLASASGGATLFFPLSLFFQKSTNILGESISKNSTTDITPFAQANFSPNLGNVLSGKPIEVPTLSSFIKFLQKTVGANILSTPQVMALDHQQASVSITEKIPVLGERTSSQAVINQFTTSTSQVDVETALIFTPHINPDVNSIRLEIEQKIDNVFKDASVPEELQKTNVAIKKRSIKTFITLKDRETAVLGGLVKETNSKTNSKIPILGDIPIIGWLFKNSVTDRKKSNLIVFITPHIVRSAEEHKSILSSKLKERMNFIRQFTGNEDPYKELTEQMLNQQENNPTNDFSGQEEEDTPSYEDNDFSGEDTPSYEDIEPTVEEQKLEKMDEVPEPAENENLDPSGESDEKDYYKDETTSTPSMEDENNINESFTEESNSIKENDSTALPGTLEEEEQVETESSTEEEAGNSSFEDIKEPNPEEDMIENMAPDGSVQ